ncbi:junctional adhesion molecule 2A [Brienomyrus brachyistius]|uniref:junctional adhesion molecule 2A n=1 Tax=Brienomyrus brachyistius TaxID=42636 RepID=UPI0020B440CD|nr:junctional adhesion molecule 2A [Brienomyrus brachyistius]
MEISILSAVLLLFLSHDVVPVSVSTTKSTVEVLENEDAVLSCEFKTEVDDKPRIEWKKRGKDVSLIYYQNKFTGDFVGRAKISGATITLSDVTYKDAGVYQCEVAAALDKVTLGETNVTLRVLVAPATPTCEIPSSALSGTVVELHCKDKHSVPPAKYKWFKDNKPLGPSGTANLTYTLDINSGTLRFSAVSRANSGLYHCEAENGVGMPKSCKAQEMLIGDLNVPLIAAAAVGAILALCLCILGLFYARRKGICRKDHRGNRNKMYSYSGQHSQDFKHTQSFML